MYVKISDKLFPKDLKFRNTLILFLISLTPNYKAFMMFRGEPYVTVLISIMVYFLIQLYQEEFELKFLNSFLFGVLIGLIALSRQWGFLFFPTVVFFTFISRKKLPIKKLLAFFMFSSIVGFLLSGWFYINLYNTYGSFAKFNLEPNSFSFLNLIKIMYLNFNINELFINPTKNSNLGGLFPIFYADLWGDYNMYFSYLEHKFTGRNLKIENYLGKVSLLSIYPSFLIIYGIVKLSIEFFSKDISIISITKKFLLFNIITTWLFYCSWIIIYNFHNEIIGGISPVYMLQLVNFFPFLGAFASLTIYKKYPKFYLINLIVLSSIFVHNIGTIFLNFKI